MRLLRILALIFVPLAILVILLGVYPQPVLDLISASLGQLSQTLSSTGAVAAGL